MGTPNLVVAIDGPRGVGKSTVCKLLVDRLTSVAFETTYFKEVHSLDEYEHMRQNLIHFQEQGGIFIVDRFAASEWVMSLATGRRKDYSNLTKECQLMAMAVEQRGINAMLMASNEVLDSRLKARNDGRDWDMPKEIVQPLWHAASGTLNIPILDTTNMRVEQVVSILYTTIRGRMKAMATKPLITSAKELSS